METSSPSHLCQEHRKRAGQASIEATPTPCNSVVSDYEEDNGEDTDTASFHTVGSYYPHTPPNTLASFFKVPPMPCNSLVSESDSDSDYETDSDDDGDNDGDNQVRRANDTTNDLSDATVNSSPPPTHGSDSGYQPDSGTDLASDSASWQPTNTGAATTDTGRPATPVGSSSSFYSETESEYESEYVTESEPSTLYFPPRMPPNTPRPSFSLHVAEERGSLEPSPPCAFPMLELDHVSTFRLGTVGGSSDDDVSQASGRGRDSGAVGDGEAATDRPRPDNWSMVVQLTGSKVDVAGLPPIEHGDVIYPDAGADGGFVKGFPLLCLMAGIMVAQFLISIDRTIISTAIPYITHEFQSTPHIGWYGSAYLLTACAFQPFFGRIFMLFSIKKAYLLAMFLFEAGSLLCGVAPNSITLIIGRAIAGLGSAGILTGSFVVVGTAVPLRARPMLMAIVGTMFGVGATTGPLLGGVFTDLVSWRWCFYVNLPIGVATVLAMLLYFHPKNKDKVTQGFFKRVLDLDMVGNMLLISSAVMLFLALESTTQGAAWSSAKVIGLFVGAGVVAILFTGWQRFKGDGALMPPRIVMQRTVAASCGMAFMIYAALINLTFFLPVWFQAIRGVSAMQSGINMIPYFVVNAVFSLAAASFVSKVGYVTPPAVIGSAIGTVGLGLMTLLRVDTTTAQWAGFQVLTAAGFGISIQQGFTAVQTVLDPGDIPIAIAAVVAAQSLGGAIFLSVGNSVFQNQLLHATAARLLDDIDIKKLIDGGAASFRHLVPAADLPEMLEIYNKALTTVFTVSIPLGGLATLISCFIQWRSVKSEKPVDSEEKMEMGEEIQLEEVRRA